MFAPRMSLLRDQLILQGVKSGADQQIVPPRESLNTFGTNKSSSLTDLSRSHQRQLPIL